MENSQRCFEMKKGSRIQLQREGVPLSRIFVGLNWGAMVKGASEALVEVDLDSGVSCFSESGEALETIFFNNLTSRNHAIKHFGDDITGDLAEDDGEDNELIQLELNKLPRNVASAYVFLNSANSQDFSDIPFVSMRIFEGSREEVTQVFAQCKLPADASFAGNIAMVVGKFIRGTTCWEFETIGEPIFAMEIEETVQIIQDEFLH